MLSGRVLSSFNVYSLKTQKELIFRGLATLPGDIRRSVSFVLDSLLLWEVGEGRGAAAHNYCAKHFSTKGESVHHFTKYFSYILDGRFSAMLFYVKK